MSEEAELICTTEIPRLNGFLYYTKTAQNGTIEIWRTPMAPSKRKKEVTQ